MSQPVALCQYKVVSGTAAGTTVVAAREAGLMKIFIPANRTGTISIYDCSTAAGTTAANAITDIACTVGSIPVTIPLGISVKDGITCVYGGTVNALFIYE